MNEMKKNYNEKAAAKEGLCVCAYNDFAVRLKYCKPTILIKLRILPGPGRSPREGNGNPLQYSCPGNPADRAAWWAAWSTGLQSWKPTESLILFDTTGFSYTLLLLKRNVNLKNFDDAPSSLAKLIFLILQT